MSIIGELCFDKNSFQVEETKLYGIFEKHGEMSWWVEIFPEGEKNYIMLNALIFDKIYSPRQLSQLNYDSTDEYADLLEHTVIVKGKERFLKSLNLHFGHWNKTNKSILLTGQGIIESSGLKGKLKLHFNANLAFSEISIFETDESSTQTFLDTYFKDSKQDLKVDFENVGSGLQAKITGQF